MAIRHAKRSAWLGAVVVAVGSALLAADDAGKTPPPVPSPEGKQAQRVEALEILRDLNELAGSLKGEKGPAKSPGEAMAEVDIVAKIGRPKRTVTKTTLDSAAIDAMLDKTYLAAKVAPAKITGDEEFIRRVTLDVTGKLPTPDQVMSFRKSTDRNKRAVLIDALLASPDYGTNWGRYWKDVIQFHATPANPGLVRFPKLEEWLADQFRKNRPWDEIAAEMITATGGTADNGATVMVAAHAGQAVELAGEVSRVFLGVQIQCAQCHDHPTDAWKRNQFHEFAAFFGGIQTRPNRMAENGPSLEILDKKGRANYSMPDLKDPAKQVPIQPKFFLADARTTLPAGLSATQRRALAASYVTGQDNPWFARAFVNRAWAALLGDGFYNPVDDIGPGRSAHGVEVLDALADAWAEGGVRRSLAVPHDPEHEGLPARVQALDNLRRQDPVRGELPEPAAVRPDPRRADAGARHLVRRRPRHERKGAAEALRQRRPEARRRRNEAAGRPEELL